uniref:Ig-like domain-containing protein n=1 Tax=Callorhinchus milii TaxID=7868 RepID=A0A4W3I611_CALMI
AGSGIDINCSIQRPESVSGMLGHSVTIPCQFSYPTEYRATKIRIYWRKYQFHGPFIFNVSEGYIHPNYSGRINFLGKPEGEKTGTIRINSLKQNDSSYYFCRVKTGGSKPQMWQSIPGTQLRVESHSTTGKYTRNVSCDSLSVRDNTPGMLGTLSSQSRLTLQGKSSRIPGSETNKDPGNETWIAVGCAVAVLLVIAIIVVVVWKRRKNASKWLRTYPPNWQLKLSLTVQCVSARLQQTATDRSMADRGNVAVRKTGCRVLPTTHTVTTLFLLRVLCLKALHRIHCKVN